VRRAYRWPTLACFFSGIPSLAWGAAWSLRDLPRASEGTPVSAWRGPRLRKQVASPVCASLTLVCEFATCPAWAGPSLTPPARKGVGLVQRGSSGSPDPASLAGGRWTKARAEPESAQFLDGLLGSTKETISPRSAKRAAGKDGYGAAYMDNRRTRDHTTWPPSGGVHCWTLQTAKAARTAVSAGFRPSAIRSPGRAFLTSVAGPSCPMPFFLTAIRTRGNCPVKRIFREISHFMVFIE